MVLLIDTNIILDFFLEREPFYKNAEDILGLCKTGQIRGVVTASSITDIFYIARKNFASTEEAYRILDALCKVVEVISVTPKDVQRALRVRAKDFEDCLAAECAKSNECLGIVTRNNKDFQDLGLKIFTPEDLIAMFCTNP